MQKKIAINISAALLVIEAITSATAAEPQRDTQVVLRAERGDTFGNLFVDWQKAFDQNRTTVIRHGKPVTSPDILLEGATLRVTGVIRLTPRAIARVDTLVKRRAALRQQLVYLVTTNATGPAALRAAQLRRMLDDDLRYASDLDFIEREVPRLEIADPSAAKHARPTWTWAMAGLAVAAILLAWACLARRQREGPGGDERMKAILSDLDQALRAPPPAS
jgi:hypothetical protein